jgi:Flp pilus assembly protein TadG
VRRRESGATTAEFALVLVFLLLTGLVGWQFAQIGLTQFKVSNAAQQAAYTAASSLVINRDRVPCWEVSNGLKDPALYGDPEVCRAITSSLGDLDPDLATVGVGLHGATGTAPAVTVTISYRQPITSPFLQLFMGPTFVLSSTASSWSR